MSKNKDILENWLERIEKEKEFSDVSTVAARTRLSTVNFYNGKKRGSFVKMRRAEKTFFKEFIKLLDERKEEEMSYAN